MQIAAEVTTPSIPGSTSLADVGVAASPAFSQHKVIRRNGSVVGFEPGKISVAVTKAFLAVEGGQSAASARIRELIASACEGLGEVVDSKLILAETLKNIYDGVPADEVRKSAVLSARALIEKDPAYSYVTARLLLHTIRREVLGEETLHAVMKKRYAEYFADFVARGIRAELLDERLANFDLKRLGAALDASRDLKFGYLGLQTLYDRYFLHIHGARIELPQAFFMRVAMGLAFDEIDRETRAIEV